MINVSRHIGSRVFRCSRTDTASDSASIQARLSLPLSGFFYNGSARGQGSDGFWWSSTASDSYDAYYLIALSRGYVDPRNYYGDKDCGDSIRCLIPGV